MEEKDLQQFIYFFTHNKGITRQQKARVDYLLAKSYKNKEEKKESGENNMHRLGPVTEKYVKPKTLQNFLLSYNQDPILKYTCHLIDDEETIASICEKCKTETYNFAKHTKLIEDTYEELVKKNKGEVSKQMYTLIKCYLGMYSKKWSSSSIEYSWKSKELLSWAAANLGKVAYPSKNIAYKQDCNGFRLPKMFRSKLTGKRVTTFADLVIFFKCQFHIRRDNSLRTIFEYAVKDDKEVDLTFSPENYYDNIELFTDVDKIVQAFKNIIKICKESRPENSSEVKIQISFYEDKAHTYLIIHHTNSTYSKTAKNATIRIGKSQSNLIDKQINGLCDLYIEADFGHEEYARINLWDDQKDIKMEVIEPMQGVKYILRF